MRSAKKKYIEVGHRFVCNAVEDCLATSNAKNKTKQYIESLIYPHKSVIVWLRKEKNIDAFADGVNGFKLSQEYRIRWIDHMVAELERQGK